MATHQSLLDVMGSRKKSIIVKNGELCVLEPLEEEKTPMVYIFLAETLGTAMLLFLGCMGVCVPRLLDSPVPPHFGSIGFGLTVLIVIQSIGHVSGAHVNPQVTLAAFLLKKIKFSLVPVYLAGEFVGAVLGFGLLKIVTPHFYSTGLCETLPHKDVNVNQAVIIEIVITSVLIIVCGSIWDERNKKNTDSTPLRFGFVVACLCIVAGTFTGASMNTARSFAPALINNNWNHHWIYWIGPTVGSLLGSLLYKYVLTSPYTS